MINKPMLFTTDDLAEGVYATSGDQPSGGNANVATIVPDNTQTQTWPGGGNYTFTASMPNGLTYPVKVVVEFDKEINTFWSDGFKAQREDSNHRKGYVIIANSLSTFIFKVNANSESLNVVSNNIEHVQNFS